MFLRIFLVCCFQLCYVSGFILEETSCPDNYVVFHESCYLFGHTGMHFVEAEHYCNMHQGHLVHVDNSAENKFIKDQLRYMKNPSNDSANAWWMGLSDMDTEDLFLWVDDGQTPTFTDWSPGQPDNGGSYEDCGVFQGIYDFHWNDRGCNSMLPPICEHRPGEQPEIIG